MELSFVISAEEMARVITKLVGRSTVITHWYERVDDQISVDLTMDITPAEAIKFFLSLEEARDE